MKKGDIILVFIVAAISIFSIFYMTNATANQVNQARKVIIELDGQVYKEIMIDELTDMTIDIDLEKVHNSIVIRNNQVYMKASNCKDQICIKQGAIQHTNQMIVCLPNRLSVRIEGINSKIDAISE